MITSTDFLFSVCKFKYIYNAFMQDGHWHHFVLFSYCICQSYLPCGGVQFQFVIDFSLSMWQSDYMTIGSPIYSTKGPSHDCVVLYVPGILVETVYILCWNIIFTFLDPVLLSISYSYHTPFLSQPTFFLVYEIGKTLSVCWKPRHGNAVYI